MEVKQLIFFLYTRYSVCTINSLSWQSFFAEALPFFCFLIYILPFNDESVRYPFSLLAFAFRVFTFAFGPTSEGQFVKISYDQRKVFILHLI